MGYIDFKLTTPQDLDSKFIATRVNAIINGPDDRVHAKGGGSFQLGDGNNFSLIEVEPAHYRLGARYFGREKLRTVLAVLQWRFDFAGPVEVE